jgi:hypothetical protein
MSDQTPISAFFAFPDKPNIAEIVRNAVKTINDSGTVQVKTWEECRVGGKLIINEICKSINDASMFCADLTGLNHNVMFELGYAIARNKRIWIALDQSVVQTKTDFAALQILTTVGYSNYCNSLELASAFLKEEPWSDLHATVFDTTIRPCLGLDNDSQLFYLKTRHATEASNLVSKAFEQSAKSLKLQRIVDDPRETSVQSITWYAEHSYQSRAVAVHLTASNREGAHLHNAKYSFVAGLAHGLDKPVLMLSQTNDSLPPLDYRDILKTYVTAAEAEAHFPHWIKPIADRVKSDHGAKQDYLNQFKLAQQLAELRVGEPIAENESEDLINHYFVETTVYKEALEGQSAIFVGRKGAGKSASFLKLTSELEADKRNLVCVIKPLAYEIQGIVELMNRYQGLNLKSFAIEAIWKFLLYSEIAKTTEAAILRRPSGQVLDCEKDLIALLNRESGMLRLDFAVRLERCISELIARSKEDSIGTIESGRGTISATLHSGLIKQLRMAIVAALGNKRRVAILVDNLDKAWDKQSDIESLSEFLLGLLSASSRVGGDFREVGLGKDSANVSLAVFIRADIFYRVIQLAREPDKIRYSRLHWNDEEVLVRVIEERFTSSVGISAAEVWKKFFCEIISGLPPRQYFLSRIMKRPRDLLFFVKAAISIAVNRKHSIVTDKDIHAAEKQYSQFALDSILVENGISIGKLEEIIYEFVGQCSILEESQIVAILNRTDVPAEKHDNTIRHLCNLTFLGREVGAGDFRFADDIDESRKVAVLAERTARGNGGVKRYQIHCAFWSFLEVAA